MSGDEDLKHDTPPKLRSMYSSRTPRRRREHTQSAHRASILRRPRPRPRSSVRRHHSGCAEHGSDEPPGLRRPPPSVAALPRHPVASLPIPKPTASLRTCSTACGRRVPSFSNARWRRGGQRTLPPHPPALRKSQSGHRGIASRLLEDLGRPVELDSLLPVARWT